MTRTQARTIRDIQARHETTDSYAQAQREAEAESTALEMWAQLFLNGEYRRAAQQWRECIHPTLCNQE